MEEKLMVHITKKKIDEIVTDCVKTVRLEEGAVYEIPRIFQPVKYHAVLIKNKTVARLVRDEVFSKEGQFRNLRIKLTEELRNACLDEDSNFVFQEIVLEEYQERKEQQESGTNRGDGRQSKDLMEERNMGSLSKVEKWFSIGKFDKASQ